MSEPILLIVERGEYKEAELKFNQDEIGKSLIPKEGGQSFGLKELLPVGTQERVRAMRITGGIENVKNSLDGLLDDAKERVKDMGAPFFVAGIGVNQYSDLPPADHCGAAPLIDQAYWDLEVYLHACIKYKD